MTENIKRLGKSEDETFWEDLLRLHQQREIDTTTLEGGKSAYQFTIEEIQEHIGSFGDGDEKRTRETRYIAPLFRNNQS